MKENHQAIYTQKVYTFYIQNNKQLFAGWGFLKTSLAPILSAGESNRLVPESCHTFCTFVSGPSRETFFVSSSNAIRKFSTYT